jgi:hypothetical protein
MSAVSSEKQFIGGHRPPLQVLRNCLEEEFEPAVVIARQGGHNAFLADLPPITLVEEVPDTCEDSSSSLPESKFGREVPDVIGGTKSFE